MKLKLPCGFDSPSGYRGRLPDGSWMLFPTCSEYIEYLSTYDKDEQ